MNVEQHLQQLIGTMAFQLAQAAAQADELRAEVARLKIFEPKPKKSRKAPPE